MQWTTLYGLLLVGVAVTVSANVNDAARPKRSLNHIFNFLSHKFFGRKYHPNVIEASESSPVLVSQTGKYKIFRLPGFKKVLVKAVPKEPVIVKEDINVVPHILPPSLIVDRKVPPIIVNQTVSIMGSSIGTNTTGDTLSAIQDVKNLLQSGILDVKQDVPHVQYVLTTNTHNVHVDGSINLSSQPMSVIDDIIKPIKIPPGLLPPERPQSHTPHPVVEEEIYGNPAPVIIDIPVSPDPIGEEIHKIGVHPVIVEIPPAPVLPPLTLPPIPDFSKPVTEEIQEKDVVPVTINNQIPSVTLDNFQPIICDNLLPPALSPLPLLPSMPVIDIRLPDSTNIENHKNVMQPVLVPKPVSLNENEINRQPTLLNIPPPPVLPPLPPLPSLPVINIHVPDSTNIESHKKDTQPILDSKPVTLNENEINRQPTLLNVSLPPVVPPLTSLSSVQEIPKPVVTEEFNGDMLTASEGVELKPSLDLPPLPIFKPNMYKPIISEEIQKHNNKPFQIPPPPQLPPMMSIPKPIISEVINEGYTKPRTVHTGEPSLLSLVDNIVKPVTCEELQENIVAIPASSQIYNPSRPVVVEETYQGNFQPVIADIPAKPVLQPVPIVPEAVSVKTHLDRFKPTVVKIPAPPKLPSLIHAKKPIVIEEKYQQNMKPMSVDAVEPPLIYSNTVDRIATIPIYKSTGHKTTILNKMQSLPRPKYSYDLIYNDGTSTTFLETGIDKSPETGHFNIESSQIRNNVNKKGKLETDTLLQTEQSKINIVPDEIVSEYETKPMVISRPYSYGLIHNDGTVTNYVESGLDERQNYTLFSESKIPNLIPEPPAYIMNRLDKVTDIAANAEQMMRFDNKDGVNDNDAKVTRYSSNPYSYRLVHNDGSLTNFLESGTDVSQRYIALEDTVDTLPTLPSQIVRKIPNSTFIPQSSHVSKTKLKNVNKMYEKNTDQKKHVSEKQKLYSESSGSYTYGLIHNDGTVTNYVESGKEENIVGSKLKKNNGMPVAPSYIMNRLKEAVATAEECKQQKLLGNEDNNKGVAKEVQLIVDQKPVVSTYVYKQINSNNESPFTVVNLNGDLVPEAKAERESALRHLNTEADYLDYIIRPESEKGYVYVPPYMIKSKNNSKSEYNHTKQREDVQSKQKEQMFTYNKNNSSTPLAVNSNNPNEASLNSVNKMNRHNNRGDIPDTVV